MFIFDFKHVEFKSTVRHPRRNFDGHLTIKNRSSEEKLGFIFSKNHNIVVFQFEWLHVRVVFFAFILPGFC